MKKGELASKDHCLYGLLKLTQKKPALIPSVNSFNVWYMKVAYMNNYPNMQVDIYA